MGLSIWISLTLPFRTLIRAKKTGLDSPIRKSDGQMVLRIVRDRVGVTLNPPPPFKWYRKISGSALQCHMGCGCQGRENQLVSHHFQKTGEKEAPEGRRQCSKIPSEGKRAALGRGRVYVGAVPARGLLPSPTPCYQAGQEAMRRVG